jgi:signal transduction histidine kinase
LRTPLNAIIGYSEMLQEEAEEIGEAAFIPDLQKVNAAGKHLFGQINDILDLSKIEAGRVCRLRGSLGSRGSPSALRSAGFTSIVSMVSLGSSARSTRTEDSGSLSRSCIG